MATLTTERGATGAAIFRSGSTELFWAGPRSGLKLIFGTGALVSIEHPSVDGLQPETLAEARAAAEAFIAAVDAGRCKTSHDMHWCDTHGAVKPDGFERCAAVDSAVAELVDSIERGDDAERDRAWAAHQEWVKAANAEMRARREMMGAE
jgi:hypothetical protein